MKANRALSERNALLQTEFTHLQVLRVRKLQTVRRTRECCDTPNLLCRVPTCLI